MDRMIGGTVVSTRAFGLYPYCYLYQTMSFPDGELRYFTILIENGSYEYRLHQTIREVATKPLELETP